MTSRMGYDSGCRAASLCFQRFSFLRCCRGSAARRSPPPTPSTRESSPAAILEAAIRTADAEPAAQSAGLEGAPPGHEAISWPTSSWPSACCTSCRNRSRTGTGAATTSRSGGTTSPIPPSTTTPFYINYILHPYWGADVLHPRPGARPGPLAIARLLGPSLDPVRVRRRGPVRAPVLPGSRRHALDRVAAGRVRLRADPQQHQGQAGPARQLGQARAGPHRSPGCRQRPDQSALRRRDPGRPDAVPGHVRLAADLRPPRNRPVCRRRRGRGRDPTASARKARPGVCSWTFAGRPRIAVVGARQRFHFRAARRTY